MFYFIQSQMRKKINSQVNQLGTLKFTNTITSVALLEDEPKVAFTEWLEVGDERTRSKFASIRTVLVTFRRHLSLHHMSIGSTF